MNIHIKKIESFSVLGYTHRAHGVQQWKVYTLAEVPNDRKAQALAKQERIASKKKL